MADEGRHTMPVRSPSGEPLLDQEKDLDQPEQTTSPPVRRRVISFFKTLLFTILVAFLLKIFVVEAFRIPSGSMENTLLVGDFLLVNKLAYGLKTPRYAPFTNLAIPSFTLPLFRGVRRGDVVVFEFPGKHTGELPSGPEYYVKRCIGLPGDTINIRSGYVIVNGREVLLPSHAKSSLVAETAQADAVGMGQQLHPAIDGNNFGPTIVPKKGDMIHLTPRTIVSWQKYIEREHHNVEVSSSGSIRIDGAETSRYVVEHDYYFMLGDNRGNSLDSRFWGFVPDDHLLGEALFLYRGRGSQSDVKYSMEQDRYSDPVGEVSLASQLPN
jgi:signal peptidase I